MQADGAQRLVTFGWRALCVEFADTLYLAGMFDALAQLLPDRACIRNIVGSSEECAPYLLLQREDAGQREDDLREVALHR